MECYVCVNELRERIQRHNILTPAQSLQSILLCRTFPWHSSKESVKGRETECVLCRAHSCFMCVLWTAIWWQRGSTAAVTASGSNQNANSLCASFDFSQQAFSFAWALGLGQHHWRGLLLFATAIFAFSRFPSFSTSHSMTGSIFFPSLHCFPPCWSHSW